MGFRFVSRDVKIAAIKLFDRELLPLHIILEICGFSERTWYRVLKLWRNTGDVINPKPSLRGHICYLDCEDVQYLLRLVRQNPDYFLDELLNMLKTNRFISVNYVTIHRELERAGISTKKLKRIAQERDEPRRANFVGRMAQYAPEELGFLDEVSKDNRTPHRRYGRSKKGRRAEKRQPFVRGQ
jgi:transposase